MEPIQLLLLFSLDYGIPHINAALPISSRRMESVLGVRASARFRPLDLWMSIRVGYHYAILPFVDLSKFVKLMHSKSKAAQTR